jgi:hypothetical protein
MKKLTAILFGAALAGTHQAHALINDGKFDSASELFISVYDEASQKSYYKDLGVTMAQVLQNQACVNLNLAQDSNYAAFAGKKGLVYNVAGVNPLLKDSSNVASWGYVATSSQGQGIFNTEFNNIDDAKQKIQSYIGAINVDPFENKPGQAEENRSGVFGPNDLGYHGKGSWGPTMGQGIGGNTEGKPGQEVEFYFVTNNFTQGKATKLGTWTLTEAGQLSYAAPGLDCNKPPVADAGPDQVVALNTPVTLDGGKSSDADGNALAFAWTKVSGPDANLAGADTAKATFTPVQAGSYVFKLAVSDGKASAEDQVTITAKEQVPTGPYIALNAPANWKVGQKQAITWATSGDITAKRPVNIRYAKNGTKFKLIKSLVNKKGKFAWKPAKKHVSTNGVLRVCVTPTKKAAEVCDSLNVVVAPKK